MGTVFTFTARMRARSIENGTRRLIVFMKHHLGLLVSMAILYGYGIHSRSRMNARWYNRERYPASIVFMKHHLRLLVSMVVPDGYGIHIRSKNECASVQ